MTPIQLNAAGKRIKNLASNLAASCTPSQHRVSNEARIETIDEIIKRATDLKANLQPQKQNIDITTT